MVVLTGAGISAESGIPTFRGPGGLWTDGSRSHRAQDVATNAAFRAMPEAVWAFYLERIARHRTAEPNAGHLALVRLEQVLADRFLLVTQNVDGLHARAGNTPGRTYRIHGDLREVRCSADCGIGVLPFPAELGQVPIESGVFPPTAREALHCSGCGGWLRPHVLWFDECYDEVHFRFESTIRAALVAGLLLVVGTSGTTNLPGQVVHIAHERGIPMILSDLDDGSFSRLAADSDSGVFLRGPASQRVPEIVEAILTRETVH